MDLKSSAEELEKMNEACQTWGPERPRVKEEEPVMGGDLEVAETDELQDNSDGVSGWLHAHVHTCVYARTHMHVHTCTYMCLRTYTHTHAHARDFFSSLLNSM